MLPNQLSEGFEVICQIAQTPRLRLSFTFSLVFLVLCAVFFYHFVFFLVFRFFLAILCFSFPLFLIS